MEEVVHDFTRTARMLVWEEYLNQYTPRPFWKQRPDHPPAFQYPPGGQLDSNTIPHYLVLSSTTTATTPSYTLTCHFTASSRQWHQPVNHTSFSTSAHALRAHFARDLQSTLSTLASPTPSSGSQLTSPLPVWPFSMTSTDQQRSTSSLPKITPP
jgi:hypothetical protein